MYQWYLTKQLKNPIEHVMTRVRWARKAFEKLWSGDYMRKIYRLTPVADERNKNGILVMGSIIRFVQHVQECSSTTCKAPLRNDEDKKRGLCRGCHRHTFYQDG